MPRVNANEVKEIIDTELTDSRIQAFILGANELVTHHLGDDLEESLLKEIERWVAAHFMTSFERQAIEEKAGPVEQKFSDVFGMGLESSTYGQTAKSLDPTGKLAVLGKKTIQLISISQK